MRIWGRVTNADGSKTWVEVSTAANGSNQAVYITWLAQALKLIFGESPFYANWGIPQQETIVTQVFPDYYVMETQRKFSSLFASLIMYRIPNTFPPQYQVSITTKTGASVEMIVPT